MRVKHLGFLWIVPVLAISSVGITAGAAAPPLVEAVKQGNAEAVRALLRQRSDVNAPAVDGTTAVHWAVHRDDLATLDLLLRAGGDAKVASRYGVTPLALACTSGNAAIIERLLKAGADANSAQPGGETALMTAARTGKVDALKVLIAHGADVNAAESTRGQTALMWAADEGNTAAVKTLVEAGANINAKSRPPAKAAKGRIDAFTPLMFAVRAGHISTTGALLEAGANVKDAAEDGTSLLTLAVANAHWELAGFLLDKGADPNAAAQGWTPLHQLVRTRNPNIGQLTGPVQTGRMTSLEVTKKFVEKGANVDAPMTKDMNDRQRTRIVWKGSTPFLLAAKAADYEMMRVLADLGADVKAKNAVGSTGLMLAGGLAMYHVSEDSGSDEAGFKATKLALELGAGDVNDADDDGDTALHGAAQRFAPDVAKLLVDHGARLDLKNNHGATAVMMANGFSIINMQKQPAVIKMLQEEMISRGLQVEMWPAGQANIQENVFEVDDTATEVVFRHGDTGEAQAARKAAVEAKAKAEAEAKAKAEKEKK